MIWSGFELPQHLKIQTFNYGKLAQEELLVF